MNELPTEIQVETLADGVRYRLPLRRLGRVRFLGLAPLVFGLGMLAFVLFWMAGASGLLRGQGPGPLNLLFASFGLLFLFPAMAPVFVGLLMVFPSRAVVTLARGRLCDTEVVGPLRWTWRRRGEQIRALRVGAPAEGSKLPDVLAGRMSVISAVCHGGRKGTLLVAMGYPEELLRPLAAELARQLGTPDPAQTLKAGAEEEGQEGGGIPVITADTPPESAELPPELPEGSRVVAVPSADGVTVMLPAMGFRGYARSMLVFSVIWCGFMVLMTGAMFSGIFSGKFVDVAIVPVLMFLVFWGVGIGIFLGCLQAARRKAVLVLTAERLVFTQVGPLRRSEREWPAGEIRDICVGDSSVSVNDRPVPQLQIHLRGGKKHAGVLTGRDPEELRWVAATLCGAGVIGGGRGGGEVDTSV